MKIDRRLILIGVMLIFLSMAMATQYATIEVGYSYSIVHPSNADIRFIGSDNSSDDMRVLRVLDNTSAVKIELRFGNLSTNQNKTYTAAFGIINEEPFAVNITHINVSGSPDYTQIWLHGNRNMKADDPTSVFMWDKGVSMNSSDTTAWILAHGDQNYSSMDSNVSTPDDNIATPWDYPDTSHVRYSLSNIDARQANGIGDNSPYNASDFVWIQISLDVPGDISLTSVTGSIWIYFEATTIT